VALVAVLVGYPLSFGPACWITSRASAGAQMVAGVYRPLIWACWRHGGVRKPLGATLDWYARVRALKGWDWTVHPAIDDAGNVVGESLWMDCTVDE
jgi:hypothetical protein